MTRTTGVVIALVWVLSLLLWFRPGLLLPDGGGYYTYLPSTWIDHDLLFFNEWQRFGLIRGNHILFKDVTPNGHLSNHWTSGPAMVWYPAFILGDILRAIVPAFHRFARDGITLPYNVPVVAISALAGLAVLLIGGALAERRFGRSVALMATVGVWFGSPLMWYSLRDGTMAHAVAAAACALVILLSLRLRQAISFETMFSAGLAIGFAAAVRPQNAIFGLVPYLLLSRDQLPLAVRRSGPLLLGALVAGLPQIIVSQALYGSPLAFVNVGGTAADWHPLEKVWFWQTLLSSYHGLFYWSPILALAVVGFLALRRADRGLGNAAIVTFVLQWAINSTLDRSFWAGVSFGARRFDGCTLFFVLGVAAAVSRLARWAGVSCTLLASAWTMSLFLAAPRINLNEYQTAGELWRAQTAWSAGSLRFLSAVPRGARGDVLLLLCATAAAALVAALAMRLVKRAAMRAAIVTVWIALVAIGFFLSSLNDRRHAAGWKPLIEASRSSSRSGSVDMELELLRQEWRYLQRTGQDEEAARTLRKAAALARQHG